MRLNPGQYHPDLVEWAPGSDRRSRSPSSLLQTAGSTTSTTTAGAHKERDGLSGTPNDVRIGHEGPEDLSLRPW